MDVALARLIGFCVDIFLSVVYTILWVSAMLTLRNKKGDNLSAVIPAVLILMFILNVAQLCLQAADVYRAFFKYNGHPGGDDEYFLAYGNGILPARDIVFWIMSVLADVLVIWRLYIIWLRSKAVMIAPVSLLLAGFTTGIIMYVYTIRRTIEGTARLTPWVDKYWEITLAFTIAVNVVTPALIIGRLYYIARQVGVLGSHSVWPYKHVAAALMESGALYTVAVIAWLIIFLTGSLPALFMSATLLPTIAAIVPCLLIIRINGNMNDNPLSRLRNLHMSTPNWLSGSASQTRSAGGTTGIQINVTQHQTSVAGDGGVVHDSTSVFRQSSKAKEGAGADSTDEDDDSVVDGGADDIEKQTQAATRPQSITITTTTSPTAMTRKVQYHLPPPPPASAMPQGFSTSGDYMEMLPTRRS